MFSLQSISNCPQYVRYCNVNLYSTISYARSICKHYIMKARDLDRCSSSEKQSEILSGHPISGFANARISSFIIRFSYYVTRSRLSSWIIHQPPASNQPSIMLHFEYETQHVNRETKTLVKLSLTNLFIYLLSLLVIQCCKAKQPRCHNAC